MSDDLRERLRQDQPRPWPVDIDAVVEAGLRRRRRRHAVMATVAVAVVVAGGLVGTSVWPDSTPPEIVDQPTGPTPEPSATVSQPSELTTVTPTDLGVDLFWPTDGTGTEDGQVRLVRSDGSETTLPVASPFASRLAMVPDGEGGVVWQPHAGAGGSPPILHAAADGATTTVVEATVDTAATFTLVGTGEGEVLVAHRQGASPATAIVDLVAVRLETGTSRVVAADVDGEQLVAATAVEPVAWVERSTDGPDRVVVDWPDRDPAVVHTEAADVPVHDVGFADGVDLYVLTGGTPPQLLRVDPLAGTTVDRLQVPVASGTASTTARAMSLSVAGRTVLVNRQIDDGWLPPLVYDTQAGTWQVLDQPGRALIARPTVAPTGPPPCADDTDLREATPPSDGSLSLYLACPDQIDSPGLAVYRQPADLTPSGDVAVDARTVLDLLLDGAPEPLQDRGYIGLSRTPTSGGRIEVNNVRFDGTTLIVDFAFPPGGSGTYSTSYGSMLWHQLLAANLLQFDQVQQVELRADGTCDYGRYFESTGCGNLDRNNAPWNSG